MKTLADLKRIKPGTTLRMTYHLHGVPEFMKERKVHRVQSNALTLWTKKEDKECESWLYFPKAKDFKGTDKGFIILLEGKRFMEYEVVDA